MTPLRCTACGHVIPDDVAIPVACPKRFRDEADHALALVDPSFMIDEAHEHPFLRYRHNLRAWHLAREHELDDDDFVEIVMGLDERLRSLDGRGFHRTPLIEIELPLQDGPDTVIAKVDAGNVGGSHKARHLMSPLLLLDVVERVGLHDTRKMPLAVASCGNAALAAALLARAARRDLQVFVPPWIEPATRARIADLGAEIVECTPADDIDGDPCIAAFREALVKGALPFSVQGTENAMVIEGGLTIAFEFVEQLAEHEPLDSLFVQVGGGALAASLGTGFRAAQAAGRLSALPRFFAVQAEGSRPLARAWDGLKREADASSMTEAFQAAATRPREFMTPWKDGCSRATGILDDITHDWRAVLEIVDATGGDVVVADEGRITDAPGLVEPGVSATGAAGLAGVLQQIAESPGTAGGRIGVVLTGAAS